MSGRRVGGCAVGAVVLAGALSSACTVNVNTEGATASETHTFQVTGSPEVLLDTFDGGIEVHTWDRPIVEVVVEKQAPDESLLQRITVEPSQDGNKVTLRVSGPERSHDGIHIGVVFSPSARLRVALPRAATLDLRSRDGNLNVEDVSGSVSMRTNDGAIIALRLTGDIRARTDDGSVRLRETTGKVDVETLDGTVVVNGTLTHLRAKSGDGSVRIVAEFGSVLTEDWLIETGDGTVDVRLPEGLAAEVDASTRDGSIRSTYRGLDVPRREGSERQEDGRQLRATLGAGGKTLRVRTGDGSIRFES
jgi:hypothetical protein